MLESDSPSRTFLGVRFLLVGFDPIRDRQVRSKLINGGGVGVGQYSQICTHVIVDRIVYDDPICVAARNDGKTVVTGLWVDHSFDTGMPIDATSGTSIIYRPVRDLNGIPGAKSLIVCLTGYQSHDREDIMTMVQLMGAQFSKPLVANKVTHLICYKFEGEKYELAKKMNTIKLVNHRWLEDCLRDWELLPEADYNQSGYELEIMEAEAKDSDEEAGETAVKQSAVRNIGRSPHDLKVRMLSATELPKSAMELQNPTLPVDPSNAKSKEISLTPGKLNRLSPSLSNLYIPETHCFQETGPSGNVASVGFLVQPQGSPHSPKIEMNLASTTENNDQCSSAATFTATYLRKTPRRSALPALSGETSGNTGGSPKAVELKDASGCHSPTLQHARGRVSTGCIGSPLKASSPYHGEDSAGKLPQKRVMDASITNSKLQKISHNAKAPIIRSPDLNVGHNSCASIAEKHSNANEKSMKNDLTSFLTVSEENRQNESAEKSPMSCRELRESTSASKSSVGSFGIEGFSHVVVEEPVVPENKERDVGDSSLSGRKLEIGPSYSTVNLDSVEGGSNKLDGELLKIKMLSRKTLGRPKVSHVANKKCSIYNNKTATENDSAICLNGVKERADHASSNKEASPSTVNDDTVKDMVAKSVRNSAANETKFIDDKTEAPGEKPFNEEKSELVDLAHKTDKTIETELLRDHCGAAMDEDKMASDNAAKGTNLESAISNKEIKLGESASPTGFTKAETKAPDEKDKPEVERTCNEEKSEFVDLAHKAEIIMETKHSTDPFRATIHEDLVGSVNAASEANLESAISNKKNKLGESTSPEYASKVKVIQVLKRRSGKAKKKTIPSKSNKHLVAEEMQDGKNLREDEKENFLLHPGANDSKASANDSDNSMEEGNSPVVDVDQNLSLGKSISGNSVIKSNKKNVNRDKICGKINSKRLPVQGVLNQVKLEPTWFILSGHRYQRKEFQQVIKRLKGRCCRDSHQWSYQATHFMVPDPVRRTEKFFAAAASGRWILKTDYLSACSQAGKFLPEEPYEWHKNGLNEDGAINLEAPRKWRLLRERTGHGAFYGMRIIVYGECIAPPLDTLKRVVKAGDGTILATSPPYTRFLKSGIDFAVVSPGMPRVDIWVQEFLKYEIPCVVADYLVEYVCKPGYSLERHVLYNTQAWAERSLANLLSRANEIAENLCTLPGDHQSDNIACQVCGSCDRGEAMRVCGNESDSVGFGTGTHIDCCDPPIEAVPEGDRFCAECSGKSRNKPNPSKRRKGGTSSKHE